MKEEAGNELRLIIAESNRIVRLGLEVIFKDQPGIAVVGQASSSKELLTVLKGTLAHVVLIDYTAAGFSIDVVPTLLARYPKLRVVAITPDQQATTIVHALRAGVTSYIKKDCDFGEIVGSIRETALGGKFFCGQILETIRRDQINVDDLDLDPASCEPIALTEREQEIIRLISESFTNQQIAEKLFLSPHTVHTHRKNIMQKLGVNNTAAIVLYAVKTGLVNANKFLFTSSGQVV